ncbi:hypothetical protein ES703_35186 [subsurface metagenome]
MSSKSTSRIPISKIGRISRILNGCSFLSFNSSLRSLRAFSDSSSFSLNFLASSLSIAFLAMELIVNRIMAKPIRSPPNIRTDISSGPLRLNVNEPKTTRVNPMTRIKISRNGIRNLFRNGIRTLLITNSFVFFFNHFINFSSFHYSSMINLLLKWNDFFQYIANNYHILVGVLPLCCQEKTQ